ncbi:MAG: class I SAM-dependent methyltransferase [Candidatus Nealsonbacteria bacterium]|nr:class I SAM-dependent methyltransferase [Candidatus Nealsonbacteria bacterium]
MLELISPPPLIIILLVFLPFLIIFFSPSSIKAALSGAPFLPTSKNIVRKALKEADLKRGEKLYDLGCGTGTVLIIGEKEFGAKVVGFEYSSPLFYLSKINFLINRIKDGIINKGDFYQADIKDADVIYLFLTPRAFKKLENKIKTETKIGARIITFSSPLLFWQPEKVVPLKERKNKINLYLYVRK